MKTRHPISGIPKRRRRALVLVPSVPSPGISRPEKMAAEALALLAKDYAVLCVPEDAPVSARLDEAALAARGIHIYSFLSITAGEVANRVKALITAAPEPEIIGIFGLETLRRHLIEARLAAPAKNIFSVLGRADVRVLAAKPVPLVDTGTEFPDTDRHLLAACGAVFCETAADAAFLRRTFGANAFTFTGISRALAALDGARKTGPVKLGVINLARPAPALDLRGAFKTARGAKSQGLAGINRIIFNAAGDIPFWAVVSRPFSACSMLWPRLLDIFNIFPNAGMVLPSLPVPVKPGRAGALGMLLEAAALRGQGKYSEPVMVDDSPLILLRPGIFKKVGGLDTRFSDPACAWTDLCLRMRQAGFQTITAEDAVLAGRAPTAANKLHALPPNPDIELLTHKWCYEGLRIMELLVSEMGIRQP
ncbi:MAG: hypothetical protein A2234_08225 [Elusimicrobia bacterium RIFOXYA2_FULL_58_8]|nr:MAG: hypothetical protein A2285_01360 [Elusimicrobia bacterium RIFOXYA12_FULL_57_11]OGS17062.1 MAG: hypothetical protein A2234_08225 [Elusimicrobia bacterium RIFOXYA2_FULL_58_8]